jgi:RNA polymerase sigma-70 factor (ECF subfamily)
VIERLSRGHVPSEVNRTTSVMASSDSTLPPTPVSVAPVGAKDGGRARPSGESESTSVDSASTRFRRIVDTHYDFVWRTVRFQGVPEATAEDAAQQVFCVVAHRLGDIAPGAELSFLYATASRVASEARRALRRRPAAAEGDVETLESPLPSLEHLLDQRRARAVLQAVLEAMPVDLRMVFVLFEIEELTVPEVASALGLREGTAASRLRRAREEFRSILKRKQAAQSRGRRT